MNPEALSYPQIGTPESLSQDPNLFERTLLNDKLEEIAANLKTKIYAAAEAAQNGGTIRQELDMEDYEAVIDCVEKLGEIGYFKTPGYEPVEPPSMHERPDMSDEEYKLMLRKYHADDHIAEGMMQTFGALFSRIKYMGNIPEGFFNSLYRSLGNHIQRNDENSLSLLYKMIHSHVMPESPEVFRDISRKILEAYDLDVYKNFAREFLRYHAHSEQAEINLLSPEEMEDIAMRLKRQSYIDQGEDLRKYAKHLKEKEEEQ
ncbi:MAG: hypothetical protein K9M11_02325 [Candidatus Pacebacteria bacterium]|nr:hypothetical protein [Candidatus Paceibacterota bacterium]